MTRVRVTRKRTLSGSGPVGGARVAALALAILLAAAALAGMPAHARELHDDQTVAGRIAEVRRALTLEEFERGVALAEALHEEYPDDLAVFWALARAYASAGMDRDDLIPLLEAYLVENPRDRRATLELGSAYAREGRPEEAHSTWLESLRTVEPADVGGYNEVGSLEMRHRMFEHAVETYLEGRSRSGQPYIFAQELTRAYVATAQHGEAIAECLNAVNENPGMVQWGMNIVEDILETTGDEALVEGWAERIASRENAAPAEMSFAGSLFALVGRFDEALEAHAVSDERGGRRGMELLEFARLMRDRGELEEAERSLALLFERHPTSTAAAAAGNERAGILVELGDPVGAVTELKRMADAFEGRPESYQALIEAARLEIVELDDPATALLTLAVFDEQTERVARPIVHEAWLVEVDARLRRGELELAYAKAGEIIASGAEKERAERARYAIGFTSFLQGEHGRAVAELREMVENHVGGRLANDAIRLMLIISDALEAGDTAQADLYASALRAGTMGDAGTAKAALEDVAGRYPGTPVASDALLRLGALARADGELTEALDAYQRAFDGTESIIVKAEARLRRGHILRTMRGRRDDAIREFESLLDELPPNHLSGEARRELEALRRGRTGE